MRAVRLVPALLACSLACGVRAPAPIDVAALVAKRGPVEARRDLVIRVLEDPRDVQARLGLAALAEQLGRPSEAIEQLDAVERLGGPLGTRWHDADRARFGRLLLARGRARLLRDAPTALADLERAAELGAAPHVDTDLGRARAALAIAQLRHVDAGERAKGRASLAELAGKWGFDPSWAGAKPAASPAEHGAFGAFLWRVGARREAYEQLAAWHAATKPPRDALLQQTYLRALGWWSPLVALHPPDGAELVGAERCRFACDVRDAVGNPDAEVAALAAPLGAPTDDPQTAVAWTIITLRAALRGEGGWLRLLAARVDLAHVKLDQVARPFGPVLAQLAGKRAQGPSDGELDDAGDDARLVAAAGRVLAGGSAEQVMAALAPAGTGLIGPAAGATGPRPVLVTMVSPLAPFTGSDARAEAVAHYADTRVVALLGARVPSRELFAAAGVAAPAALTAIAVAFRRDPAIAERLGRELVASATDGALAHATLGWLFAALGDPARSRVEWQAAVDASDEPAFAAGYANAAARTGDGDAALVAGIGAAAASGDPAVVWTRLARTLLDARRGVDALTAARSAIDLAGPDALPGALDIAIEASRLLGRTAQADALAAQRARLAPPTDERSPIADDVTDAIEARVELEHVATATSVARAWIASRWNPRDVAVRAALLDAIAPDDPRRGTVVAELIALAGDADDARALAAALALRR
jgi:hypothetical protein